MFKVISRKDLKSLNKYGKPKIQMFKVVSLTSTEGFLVIWRLNSNSHYFSVCHSWLKTNLFDKCVPL